MAQPVPHAGGVLMRRPLGGALQLHMTELPKHLNPTRQGHLTRHRQEN